MVRKIRVIFIVIIIGHHFMDFMFKWFLNNRKSVNTLKRVTYNNRKSLSTLTFARESFSRYTVVMIGASHFVSDDSVLLR